MTTNRGFWNAVNRRTFLGWCGQLGTASALWTKLPVAGTLNQNAQHGVSRNQQYGSGYFGEWITDEFGLPAFRYTCDQIADPKAITPTDVVFRSRTDQTHQVGNDRLVAAVSNYGYVQVRQDEGSPKFLNDYVPERRQFGGGVGYLTDGKVILGTFYPGSGESFERIFGAGYVRKKVAGFGYSADQVIFAPFGDDPVLLSQVTIANRGKSAAQLRWIEYWGCQVYQFSYRTWMEALVWQGSQGKAVELRRRLGDRFTHDFHVIEEGRGLLETKRFLGRTAEDERLWQSVQDVAAAQAAGDFATIPASVGEASMEDLDPPPTFLASLDGPVQGFETNGWDFFGSDGVGHPDGLARGLGQNLSASGPESALLLERKVSVGPGQTVTLHFLYGYLPKAVEAEALIDKYQLERSRFWARSTNEWKKRGPCLTVPGEPWVERELTWSYYYLRSDLTYDDFFEEHILSQSGEYQYLTGFQAAARDPLQHALPFVYSDPAIVKEVLRYTLKEVRPNGSIPYGIVGHGIEMPTSQDDSSDLPLWLIWLACEYVLATRDVAFLNEALATNIVNGLSVGRDSPRNLLARCFRHLTEDVGTGPHGLMRMLMDDWDDGLVYAAVPLKWRQDYIRKGESVPNSAMASYVFELYAKLLDFIGGQPQLALSAKQKAEEHRQAVRNLWTGRWFPRAWLGPRLGWLGIDNIWLEPQPWAIIGGAASSKQNRILVRMIDKYLRRPSRIGATLWSPAGKKSDPGGSDEVDLSPNGWLIWALAMVDGEMAWDTWKRNSLAQHAESFPDVWYGTWSGSDGYTGPSNQFPGQELRSPAVLGTGKGDVSVLDFPVMNMHSHAWPLYSAAKLLGIEFTPKGLLMSPALPLETYRFASPLLGFEKSPGKRSGWYAPPGQAGAWIIKLRIPGEEIGRLTRLEVNGAERPLRVDPYGSIDIYGESTPGRPLRWSIYG